MLRQGEGVSVRGLPKMFGAGRRPRPKWRRMDGTLDPPDPGAQGWPEPQGGLWVPGGEHVLTPGPGIPSVPRSSGPRDKDRRHPPARRTAARQRVFDRRNAGSIDLNGFVVPGAGWPVGPRRAELRGARRYRKGLGAGAGRRRIAEVLTARNIDVAQRGEFSAGWKAPRLWRSRKRSPAAQDRKSVV